MTTAAPTSSPSACAVKVNVRLCGSMPRQEMESLSLTKCAPLIMRSSHGLGTNSYLAGSTLRPTHRTIDDVNNKDLVGAQLCSQLSIMQQLGSSFPQRPVAPIFEAPSWAVPAQGEARLEPICNSYSTQLPVDLTGRSVYRIGRSPQSDVLLLHATSSRRHAMLFHHSNGSCYIVDCGSAHGTYVNGHRIKSAPNGRVVVPHKVRRGSIVRFGGPGAPEFMLKSFSFDLEDMRYPVSANPSLSPTSAATAIVQHNTRLNALGKTAKDSLFYSLSSKRSFDSVETAESDFESNRCTSPPLSPEQQPIRLVSPDIGQPRKRRRVHFSSEPPRAFYPNLISPDLSSDENDCDESH